MGTDCWRLDHVLVDGHAVPTFVHSKLSADWLGVSEVGSHLAYLASKGVSVWNANILREAYETRCLALGTSADQAMEKSLGLGPTTVDAFWQQVAENLQKRRIRLIFAANKIPGEVRTLVEFLNADMTNVEILTAEVGFQSAA